jgi:hypothetical protein
MDGLRYHPHPDPLPSREREESFYNRGCAPLELPDIKSWIDGLSVLTIEMEKCFYILICHFGF